jgi:hypothetical protein
MYHGLRWVCEVSKEVTDKSKYLGTEGSAWWGEGSLIKGAGT